MANRIIKEIGHVSVVVNNAGIMPSHPLLKHTENEIRQVFEVNVFANFWILEAFLPHMIAKGRGHVIAMSSMAGLCGLNNLVPMCRQRIFTVEINVVFVTDTILRHKIRCTWPNGRCD